MKKMRVACAMSGGVDSSVAAYLLKERGHEVIGLTMEVWQEERNASLRAIEDAKKVCSLLGIPHHVVRCRRTFKNTIVRYFTEEYAKGRTPNPCVFCNRDMKFGLLMDRGAALGAERFATGHYALVSLDRKTRRYTIRKGLDPERDQSYFLAFLDQNCLARTIFPLGALSKREVRKTARAARLPVAEKAQSQEVCFIPDNDYRAFLHRLGKAGKSTSGPIRDMTGRVLGRHTGLGSYTIGQRKGLGISDPTPFYVYRIVPEENALCVGKKEDLFQSSFTVKNLHPVAWKRFPDRFSCEVKIRYRNPASRCRGMRAGRDRVRITLDESQWAPTPGQIAVFYRKDIVLGAGIISQSCNS